MGVIIGREREFDQAWQGLQKARRDSVPTVVRIAGISGIGKTALLESLLAAAAESWLVVRVDCHRIQAGSPLVVIRRTLAATLSALGDQRERYNAGLESTGDDASALPPDSLLLRLLEGVLHDHALVIALDDAQWADTESLRAAHQILIALSDRPIVVVTTERAGEEISATRLDADTSVALERLSDQDVPGL